MNAYGASGNIVKRINAATLDVIKDKIDTQVRKQNKQSRAK
jgi:hypothetical protein